MNKKYLQIPLAILMVVVLVTAQAITNSNDNVDISKSAKNELAKKDVTSPITSETICIGDICRFRMYQDLSYNITQELTGGEGGFRGTIEITIPKFYNLGTHKFNNSGMSDGDMKIEKNKIVTEWLEGYAISLKERDDVSKDTRLGEGIITIREKK